MPDKLSAIISIHAPARGATAIRKLQVWRNHISIHAPARGATDILQILLTFHVFQSTLPQGERHCNVLLLSGNLLFQSTLPQGERLDTAMRQRLHHPISIHAPARGATPVRCPDIGRSQISIHAPARGATVFDNRIVYIITFQSTLPQGERQSALSALTRTHNDFNPRSRKGSDRCQEVWLRMTIISIHAPARGATFSMAAQLLQSIFQSTLPQGERQQK